MKITTDAENGNLVKIELESDAAYYTFKAGVDDRKQWTKHPETCEMSNFLRDNLKFSQVFVGYNDTWLKIK